MANKNEINKSFITLPLDHYGHKGAPSEWWWHIGTLESKDGRQFGFEINAASMNGLFFTQIEITDVSAKVNHQKIHLFTGEPAGWAPYDPSKPWHVQMVPLLTPFDGGVVMQEVGGNPLNMLVQASFIDAANKNMQCQLILNFNQGDKQPLLVWGTGRTQDVLNPQGKTPLEQYNFYYSLTNLRASGYLIMGSEIIEVTGLTWMDHQYGYFGNPAAGGDGAAVHWMLQDMQLTNGLHISNSYVMSKGEQIKEGKQYDSYATVLFPTGESKLVATKTRALGPTYTENGIIYFMNFEIEVNEPSLDLVATFHVASLLDDQVFHSLNNYEGIGKCVAKFHNMALPVKGTAWIEQTYGKAQVTRF